MNHNLGITAVIFDLDGTIISNEDVYGNAFRKVLASLGKKVSDKYPHIGGIGVKENWPILLSKHKIKTKLTIEELTRFTQEIYLKNLSHIEVKKGFENFVENLKVHGILTALATSNSWWIVDEVIQKLDLAKLFNEITTGEEVDYLKPDPDLFLLTAEKLGVDPSGCLVIEDAEAGITAAKRAGMKVVGIARDSEHAKSFSGADLIIRSYSELTPKVIRSMILTLD